VRVETRHDVTVVPPSAIQRGPTGAYVYVIKPDNTATRRNVTVSHEDLQTAIVSDGLKLGEMTVTDGASRLFEGSKVVIADPNAPPPPSTGPVARQRPRSSS
jgi:multidrug efflux system membrane fusion protein